MRAALTTLIIVITGANSALAVGPGTAAAEVACGFGGGVALALAAVPVGNVFATEAFPGTGLYGLFLGYPAGAGPGVYAAGEIRGEDSANDGASAGAARGRSYRHAPAAVRDSQPGPGLTAAHFML